MASSQEEESPKPETPPPKESTEVEHSPSNVTSANAQMQSGGLDDSCNDPPRNLLLADDLMEQGWISFTEDLDFTDAAECFEMALDIWKEKNVKLDLDCAPAYYKYGLALLYEVPIPEDDPMAGVPKEIDYQLGPVMQTEEYFHNEEAKHGGIVPRDAYQKLEAAKKELNVAWSIVNKEQPGNSMEKVDILSALGEVTFRQDEFECYDFYCEALHILEQMVEPDNPRIAHLNFKICLRLESCSRPYEACTYCKKAVSVAKARLKHLTTEIEIALLPGTPATMIGLDLNEEPRDINDLIMEKRAETGTLKQLCRVFQLKIGALLIAPISNSNTLTSGNLEKTSTKATPTSTSSAKGGTTSRQLQGDPAGKRSRRTKRH